MPNVVTLYLEGATNSHCFADGLHLSGQRILRPRELLEGKSRNLRGSHKCIKICCQAWGRSLQHTQKGASNRCCPLDLGTLALLQTRCFRLLASWPSALHSHLGTKHSAHKEEVMEKEWLISSLGSSLQDLIRTCGCIQRTTAFHCQHLVSGLIHE